MKQITVYNFPKRILTNVKLIILHHEDTANILVFGKPLKNEAIEALKMMENADQIETINNAEIILSAGL